MNDQELARALHAAVNVDHSPQFLARVRARVAVEHAPVWPVWPPRWRFALAAAALSAAALVAAIVAWPAGERSAPVRVPVTVSERTTAPRTTDASPPTVAVLRRHATTGRRSTASRFPEVVIAAEDARGFELLITSARARRIPAELPTDAAPAGREVTLAQIEVPLVVIEPLSEIARLEGDRP